MITSPATCCCLWLCMMSSELPSGTETHELTPRPWSTRIQREDGIPRADRVSPRLAMLTGLESQHAMAGGRPVTGVRVPGRRISMIHARTVSQRSSLSHLLICLSKIMIVHTKLDLRIFFQNILNDTPVGRRDDYGVYHMIQR